MATRKERLQELFDRSPVSANDRQERLIRSDPSTLQRQRNLPDDFDRRLRERRELRRAQSEQNEIETPTFETVRDRLTERSQERRGVTPEREDVVFGLPQKPRTDVVRQVFQFTPQETQDAKRDIFSKILVGTGSDRPLGREADGVFDYAKEKGVIGFLYGTTLKSSEQRTAERYEKLVQDGVEPERAFQIARGWKSDTPLPTDLSDSERISMRNFTIWENAFIALELADLLLVGKPLNAGLKTMTKGAKHELFQGIAKAKSTAEARRFINTQYPNLAGTEGVEELIDLGRRAGTNNSWRDIISQTKTADKILKGAKGTERVRSTTEAQRVFYENGIPIVRGGDVPATTITRSARQTPDFTADAVALRKQINDVLAGTKESARLSNLEVFADEVRAGAIPFKNQVDDQVEFFVSSEVPSGRLRPGDRLASSKELIEEVSEAGKARVEKVLPKNLVRLDDGTFVYAPADQVGKGVQGTLRSLRQSQRSRVQAIEQSKEMSRIEREANQQAQAARNKEIAKQQAAERAKAVAQAQRLVDNAPARKQQELNRLRTARQEKINEIKDAAKQAGEKISSDSVQRRIAATRAQFNQAIQEQRRLFDERLAEAKRLTSAESKRKATKKAAQAKKKSDDFNAETTKAFKEAKEKATEEANLTEQYGTLRPVQGDGKVVADQVVQGLQDKISAARKAVGIDETAKGSSATKDKIEQLPFLHRVATNEEQLKIAVKKVATDPAAAYRELIQGSDESTVAHLAFALLDSKYIADDVNRLSMLIRKVDEVATASGQQLQAFNIFNKHDYTTIVRNLMRQGEEMMAVKKIDKAAEVRKIEEALGKRFDELATASKQGLLDEFGEIICK